MEAVGLWMMKRWAEYLTFIATGAFLPYELSELVSGPSVLKLGATVINLAVLGYLLFSKRLFGVRGGAARRSGSATRSADGTRSSDPRRS